MFAENLVLFRSTDGRYGLLDLHCSHRGRSLGFGIPSPGGIRCCYHGWRFGVDGEILETPGDPPDSTLRHRLCHGACPVQEYRGVIFGFFAPPDKIAELPVYDSFDVPGDSLVPYSIHYPCNWLQVHENVVDPVHTVFLHHRVSFAQFQADVWGELPVDWLTGPDGVLDPGRWFSVMADMFANGLSTGPSNTAHHPSLVTPQDNVSAQRRLLAERFGVERLAPVYGWSMGAQQAYHWAALHAEQVERAVIVCGSARTAVNNQVFLLVLLATLEAAPEHLGGGRFSAHPVGALKAFARIYAGWALSQDFYRAGLHLGAAPDLDSVFCAQWEDRWLVRDAANLYAQLRTWLAGDISQNARDGGGLAAALGAIKAKILLMPSETDLYFRVADNALELPFLRNGALRPIPSVPGHRAGNSAGNRADTAFLQANVREWLDA